MIPFVVPRAAFKTWGLILWGVIFCIGCQPAGELSLLPGMLLVTGTVTLDGQPLDQGRITLISEEAADAEDPDQGQVATISNGTFQLQAAPGRYSVRIQKYQYDKKGRNGKPILPEKYDRKTTLSAEVSKSGLNPLSFQLESKVR